MSQHQELNEYLADTIGYAKSAGRSYEVFVELHEQDPSMGWNETAQGFARSLAADLIHIDWINEKLDSLELESGC